MCISSPNFQKKQNIKKQLLTHTDTCIIITSSGERNHQHVEQKDLDSNSNPITYIA